MNCPFFVGQKVTMKNDHSWHSCENVDISAFSHPVFGQVYTISGFVAIGDWVGLTFSELPVPSRDDKDGGWHHECFRPVSEGKTDTGMRTLKKLLKGGKTPVREEA